MKKLVVFMFLALVASVPAANATIGGKSVIYVHGLQTLAFDRDITQAAREADARAQSGVLRPFVDHFIFFDSAQRLNAQNNSLRDQINAIANTGSCVSGCLIITASTGDLVTRHFLSRLNQWGVNTQNFRITATFDVVGAGGGTELADLAASVVGNPFLVGTADLLAGIILGADVNSVSDLGIVNDLRPAVARSTGTAFNSIPKLRIAAGDGGLTSAFISGGDDGVVPLHSACGSSRADGVSSCSRSIEIDGRLRSADGPRSFMFNHFPIIMAEDIAHTEAADDAPSGTLVAVNNNRSFNGVDISFNERSFSTGWWIFKRYFRTIDKPSSQSLGDFLISEID